MSEKVKGVYQRQLLREDLLNRNLKTEGSALKCRTRNGMPDQRGKLWFTYGYFVSKNALIYNRIISEKIKNSSKSILLLGARQVGKSTLLKAFKPDLSINLAHEDEYFNFQGNNLELPSRIAALKPKTIFIDEIHRIPRLLNTIQAIADDNPKIKFYLSGSSARK